MHKMDDLSEANESWCLSHPINCWAEGAVSSEQSCLYFQILVREHNFKEDCLAKLFSLHTLSLKNNYPLLAGFIIIHIYCFVVLPSVIFCPYLIKFKNWYFTFLPIFNWTKKLRGGPGDHVMRYARNVDGCLARRSTWTKRQGLVVWVGSITYRL